MEVTESAFKELVYRHRDLIWRICSSYRLNAAWSTEDAFQEVLCVLWKGFAQFDGRSTERTWIFRVATNTMISLQRKTGNRPSPLLSDLSSQFDLPEPSEPADNHKHLYDLIEATSEPDRTIIKAHLQGFSYAETAKATGLSVGAVSIRLSRALRRIKKQYEQ